MRHSPASSHGSRAYDPPYYVPGGFCLPAQSAAPDYDVVPDLSARTDTLPPRTSPTRLAAVLQAGYSLIAMLIAASHWSRAEESATLPRHAGTTTHAQ
jgi:hypothetical protein